MDLALSIGAIALGAWLYVMTLSIARGSIADPVGSRGILQAVAVVLMVGGLALTIRRLRGWKSQEGNLVAPEGYTDKPDRPASGARAMGIVAVGVLYGLLLEPVGFPLLTPPALAAGLLLMQRRSVRLLLTYSLVLTAIVHFVFVWLFDVFLPLGPLSPWQDYLWFQL